MMYVYWNLIVRGEIHTDDTDSLVQGESLIV
jgi:hypothetical protein